MSKETLSRTPYQEIARQALHAYKLAGQPLAFIRHSDSVAYRVGGSAREAYLLRVHRPITSALGDHGTDPAAIRSEMLWREALARETEIPLQRPLRNRHGDLLTLVPAADGDELVTCTLLHWVEGEPYHRDLETEATAAQIGEIMAQLHQHAGRWELPPGFQRPRRDVAYFQRVLLALRPAVEDGRIRPADYRTLERSTEILVGMMRELPAGGTYRGLMHADLHKGNLLIRDGRIWVIDFSFCAFGHFCFDLAIALSDMKRELHQSCLESYQRLRPLPPDYRRLIEAFFLGSMVGTFSYWVANPRAQDLLVTKVFQNCRDFALPFNRNESFWFADLSPWPSGV